MCTQRSPPSRTSSTLTGSCCAATGQVTHWLSWLSTSRDRISAATSIDEASPASPPPIDCRSSSVSTSPAASGFAVPSGRKRADRSVLSACRTWPAVSRASIATGVSPGVTATSALNAPSPARLAGASATLTLSRSSGRDSARPAIVQVAVPAGTKRSRPETSTSIDHSAGIGGASSSPVSSSPPPLSLLQPTSAIESASASPMIRMSSPYARAHDTPEQPESRALSQELADVRRRSDVACGVAIRAAASSVPGGTASGRRASPSDPAPTADLRVHA
jgi:hypothetical protein